MRFVFEIPEQVVAAASSGDTATAAPVIDAFSGGPAPGSAPSAAAALGGLAADSADPAVSAGEAEHLAGGVAIDRGPDRAIDGGAAPSGN